MATEPAIYTGDDLRKIWQGQNQEPGKASLLFSAHLVNYTPLMLGDYQGRHFRCLDPECSTKVPSPGLFAQAIRGKARWLARTVLASLEDCSRYQTYREIEQRCAPIEVAIDQKKKIKLGLIEYMFGTIRGGAQFSSPFNLVARVVNLENKPWSPKLPVESRNLPDRYHALLKRNDEASLGVPLAPFTTEINVSIYLAANADTSHSRFARIASFYVGLVAVTPLLLGLGKATTRGFGRFMFKDRSMPELGRYISRDEALSALIGYSRSLGSTDHEEEETKKLHGIIEMLLRLGSNAAMMRRGSQLVTRIPRLVNATPAASGPRSGRIPLATVVKTNARCVNDAIMFIAASTVKAYWKNSRAKWAKDSGIRFHTWPLGLPRVAEPNCKCRQNDRPIHKPELAFGYVAAEETNLPKTNKDHNVDVCLPYSKCLEQGSCPNVTQTIDGFLRKNTVRITREGVKGQSIRHQSMFILFPLPPCSSERSSLVAVLPFIALSLNLSIDKGAPYVAHSKSRDHTKPGSRLHLLHLGGHTGGKFPPCCNTHVVDVGYAIRQADVKASLDPQLQKCKLCDCGRDTAGIQGPPGHGGYSWDYFGAINAAYDWLLYCLSRLSYNSSGRLPLTCQ